MFATAYMHKRDQTKYRPQRRLLHRIKAGAPVGMEVEKKKRTEKSTAKKTVTTTQRWKTEEVVVKWLDRHV